MKTIALFVALHNLCAINNGQNMNGDYIVASGTKQNVPFNSDYASKGHEYFDVWAPEIATHYGDVFWTDQGILALPDDIIKRFAGKVIAITGYEQDQVMVQPTGEPGVNPDKDVSVPINWAYNHHYMAWMIGKDSVLKQVPINYGITNEDNEEDIWYHHGLSWKWMPQELPSAQYRNDLSIPTSQMYSEGNGGESRKSFHGYPNGFAQLLESPQSWHITPMQIDTRNRECGASYNDTNNCTTFFPGIEPLQARYGRAIDPKIGTNYSGLLECPCNGKFGGDPVFYGPNTMTKEIIHNYVTLQSPQCIAGQGVVSETSCFNAVKGMGFPANMQIVDQTVTDSTNVPLGCTIQMKNNAVYATFNLATNSKAKCSTSAVMTGDTISGVGVQVSLRLNTSAGSVNITFLRSPKGQYCGDNHQNVLGKFPSASNSNADQVNALNKCEGYCKTDDTCTVCSVDCSLDSPNTGQCQWVALPRCGTVKYYTGPNGLINGDISRKESEGGIVNITISGPSDGWFGVGFNATEMADSPWTLIVNATAVIEQKIGTCGSEAEHCPGYELNKTITVLSNTVNAGIRTVIVQRALIGKTKEYYSFIPDQDASINLITAIGYNQTFAYHKAHATTIVSLVMASGDTCVCDTGSNGHLCEADGTSCRTFVKNCVPSDPGGVPDGVLLAENNPTCNSRQYCGGLSCCINGHNLLDVNQEIPAQLLRYHMKFRFWFQEYYAGNSSNGNVPSHYNLPRIYQQTEANAGEYDVPPAFALPNQTIVGYPNWPLNEPTPGTTCTGDCPNGEDCECVHEIHYRWIESSQPMRLIYAGGHCHAPSCISLTLYRNDTGAVLCSQIPVIGQGNVDKDKFDEAGYILIPPCLWGNDTGLEPSVLLPANTPLLSIKKNHNTHLGHFGEMASWQMRGVNF